MHGRFRVSGVPPQSEAPNLHDCRAAIAACRRGAAWGRPGWPGSKHPLNLKPCVYFSDRDMCPELGTVESNPSYCRTLLVFGWFPIWAGGSSEP